MKPTTKTILILALVAAVPTYAAITDTGFGGRIDYFVPGFGQQSQISNTVPFQLAVNVSNGTDSASATAEGTATFGPDEVLIAGALSMSGSPAYATARILSRTVIDMDSPFEISIFATTHRSSNASLEFALWYSSFGNRNPTSLLWSRFIYDPELTAIIDESFVLPPGQYLFDTDARAGYYFLPEYSTGTADYDLTLRVSSVPEPTATLLCLFGFLFACRRQRNDRDA